MNKRALVLGGGGAKGSYQMGAWQAFRELELGFDIITGTSIGSINGALMVQDAFEIADKLWNSIEYENIFREERKTNIRTINSALDMVKFAVNDALLQGSVDSSSLEALIKQAVDEDKVRASSVRFGLVTVELPSMRPLTPMIEEISHGMLYRYLMASASCFPVFSPYEIDGVRYIDGGYYDNVPINLAIQEGADYVVAVDLDGIGFVREPVSEQGVDIVRIRSYWDLGAVFEFDKNIFARNRRLGYYDTMKAFGKLDGYYYTFGYGESAKNLKALEHGIPTLRERITRLAKSPMVRTISTVEKDVAIDFLMKSNWESHAQEKLCRAAEIAGAVYGISPEQQYTFEKFNNQLLRLYHTVPSVLPTLELQPKEDIKRILAAALQSMEPRRMSASITQLMLREQSDGEAVRILAGLLPREYAAATYLALLLKQN
ncbi:patatin-like phospholipase family protein [Oscillospiraceae bacterium LTW-04]|nr:patatin-like phospholipase family protein [Oscillospiraceae bacterium MB24-C1]